jgi:hypothetical protein
MCVHMYMYMYMYMHMYMYMYMYIGMCVYKDSTAKEDHANSLSSACNYCLYYHWLLLLVTTTGYY